MTAALLKQALEALEECKSALSNGLDERTGQPAFKSVAAMLAHMSASDAASALTAFDSLSEYDKAIHAIAPYLPDWVRFVVCEDNNRLRMFGEHADPFFIGPQWGFTSGMPDPNYPGEYTTIKEFAFLRVPNCCGGSEKSLRRITHNSDGTVTVERG